MKDSSSTDPTRPVNDDELREMTVERAGRADATGVVEEVRRAARVTRQTGAWRRSVMPTERTAPGRRSWVAGLGVAAAVLVAVALVESGLPWIGPTASGSAVPGGATSSAPTPAASVAILPSPTTVATAAPPDLWTSVTWMPVDVAVYMTNAVWFRDGFLALGPMNRDVRTIPATSTVWRSADGQTWERVPGPPVIPTDGSLAWLEAGADAAVIMGARDDGSGGLSPALWRSSDGLVWEKVFGEVVSHAEPFQLVAGPGGFLAAASDGSGVWRSTDGASWDSLGSTIPIDPSGTATSSVYLVPTIPAAAADAFFAITATGATSSRDPDYAQTLWRSTDGRAWSRVVGPEPVLITWLYPGRDGMLLSVSAPSPVTSLARSTPAWWQSVDGRSWTKLDTLRGLDAGFNSWVVSDGTWVYAFSPVTGRLAASLDGLSWQEIPAYAGPGVPSFAYWASFTRVTAGPAGIFGTGGAAIPGSSSPGIWVAAPGAPPPGSQPLGPEIIRDFPCPGGQECGG